MSFKGITWAGNVYQKFETMCLEVEEAMYQDTVKYMENQVQKVGVSVKKFCSEVMDDMRPLSCIDPMSLASDDLSLIDSGYTDVDKKPIPSILDNRQDLKKNEDQVISNASELFSPQSPGILIEHKSPEKCAAIKKIGVQRRLIGIKRISKSNRPSKDSCRNTSKSEDRSKVADCDTRTSSQMASDNSGVTSSSDFNVRCDPGEAVKGNVPNLDNPIESPGSYKGLSSESARQDSSRAACDDSHVTTSSNIVMHGPGEAVKGNVPNLDNPIDPPGSNKGLSSESVRQDSSRAASDDSQVTTSSNIVMHEPGEAVKGNTPLDDNLIKSSASQKVLLGDSTRQTEDVSDYMSPASDNNLLDESVRLKGDNESTSSCASVNDISSSVADSSLRSKVCDLECEEKGVTVSDEGTSMKDGLSSVDSTACNAESCKRDLIVSNKDSFDIEFVENNKVVEPRLENFFETSGRHDLDESCILVEGDELICALQGTRKHKSYKKRIREALASKLRSKKHEQLLSVHKQESMSVGVSEEEKISARDSVESDWELL